MNFQAFKEKNFVNKVLMEKPAAALDGGWQL